MVAAHIAKHLARRRNRAEATSAASGCTRRTSQMNELIARRVLGRDPSREEAPVVLDEYANTSSAGSIIAFHKHHADLEPGATGVLCSFGAGYSIGSVILRRR
jgi:beta-ketodecanoyl-[acyl-carrier-protein] synthase